MTSSEYEKILQNYEKINSTSIENFFLLTSDGIPFYHPEGLEKSEAVRYAGLISDILLLTKKTLDTFKTSPPNTGNMSMRLRLKNGKEIIIIQEHDLYLVTIQVCKEMQEELEEDKK